MAIKFINTKHFGQIVGDVVEQLDNSELFTIRKPAYVQIQQDPQTGKIGSAMMAVMTAFVTDDILVLNKDDIVGGTLYEPSKDIYNQYQERFGSGLVLNTGSIVK